MSTETKSRKGIGGPKTKEGKERVRLNALKMGLHANTLEGMQAVSDVIEVQFDEINQQMRDYYRPHDAMEDALVHRIARCLWKLRVIETMEDYLLRGMMVRDAPGASLESLSVIERRTDVQLHRTIQALASKRKQDREILKNKLNELPPPGKWPRPEPDITEDEPQESPESPLSDSTEPAHSPSCKSRAERAVPGTSVSPPAVSCPPNQLCGILSVSPRGSSASTGSIAFQ